MANLKKLGKRKRIALVAHDHKKADLIEWAIFNKIELAKHELFATGTTGKLIEAALDRPVKKLLSGPLGGDQQIGAMIAQGEIDVMFFFWDPMEAQPHDSDVKALLRLCVAWNIPMACDRATADFIMTSPFMHEEYLAAQPDYTGYLNRDVKEEQE
jgi:methylglyoxal synthase